MIHPQRREEAPGGGYPPCRSERDGKRGETVRLSERLSRGPVVLNFYNFSAISCKVSAGGATHRKEENIGRSTSERS